MFKEKYPEMVQSFLPMKFLNNIKSFQDNLNSVYNSQISPIYINKKEKEFIVSNNKAFYLNYKKIYNKNIELKKKLKELVIEKKRLFDSIIKSEQKIINSLCLNNEKSTKADLNITNNYNYIFTPFTKKKRIRRKKTEIINKYKCNFPNCDKSYPSKCSLNMHIRLKHTK